MKNSSKNLYASLALAFLAIHTYAHDEWSSARPDGHAPIGVMGDHYHKTGEWMFSYRYMFMNMDGNRSGQDELSFNQIAFSGGAGYPVVPLSMDMQMHMFGAMYALTDRVTLMGMLPYKVISMDHRVSPTPPAPLAGIAGASFTTESDGLGDFRLSGLIKLFNHNGQSLHLNAGLSLPWGSISETDVVPVPGVGFATGLMPYPMQLGSGTVDLLPGLTYLGQAGDWSWGAQALGTIRLGRNSQGYSLGDQIESSTWIARRLNDTFSGSFRLKGTAWGNIDGADRRLGTLPIPVGFGVPTADPKLRSGSRVDALFGLNAYVRKGFMKGHRFAVEGGLPVYQYLRGPQLQTEWTLMVGWQYAF